jgi:hypothetical protein
LFYIRRERIFEKERVFGIKGGKRRVNILHPKASTSYCPLSSARHALKRKKYRWESELGGDPVGFVKKGEKKVFVIDFDYFAEGALHC